jgi:NADH-quinone oxidoreductase subunit M
MLAHGISTGGLFLIVGMLSDRRHTRLISEYGGIKAVMPQLVAAFLLITLASIALPGMNGFVGEFLILLGSFTGQFDPGRASIYTAVAASGVILSAVYMLWMFQRVNYGPLTNDKNRGLRDLSLREWFVIAPICATAIVMGVVPNWFLKPMEPSVRKTIEQVRPLSVPRRPVNTELKLRDGQAEGQRPKAEDNLAASPLENGGNSRSELRPSAYGLRPDIEARR